MATDRGMDKEDVVHMYNVLLLSHKKEWNNAIWSNMDGPKDYHTKWTKTEKDKYHMISLTCGISKGDRNEVIYKTETHSQASKTNWWLPKGKSVGRDKLGVWD